MVDSSNYLTMFVPASIPGSGGIGSTAAAIGTTASSSHLVEPGIKSFLVGTLKKCHQIKEKYFNIYMNIGCLIIFVGIVWGVLYYKYKGRIPEEEVEQKRREKELYLMSMIQKYQQAKTEQRQRDISISQQRITNLPTWNETELMIPSR